MKFHVTVDSLNVRNRPNSSARIIRQISFRDTVDAIEIGGVDAWIRIGEDEWCAVKLGRTVYCEPGEPPIIPTHPIGFGSPVGTDEERASGIIWPGKWTDVNPYGPYSYHTGADLNLNFPTWNADRDAIVHAVSSGVVTCAKELDGTWSKVIVIEHYPLSDGTPIFSRYAHLNLMFVNVGDTVEKDKPIGTIGTMPGYPYHHHLHFDISNTVVLKNNPGHWPGGGESGRKEVHANYVDPKRFLKMYGVK